jgi:hypothetical protein
MLFRSIRERWRASRGPQLENDLNLILGSAIRIPPHLEHGFLSTLAATMGQFESEFDLLDRRGQLRLIKKARSKARRPRNAREFTTAMGVALVGIYFEASITPGPVAERVKFRAKEAIERFLDEA